MRETLSPAPSEEVRSLLLREQILTSLMSSCDRSELLIAEDTLPRMEEAGLLRDERLQEHLRRRVAEGSLTFDDVLSWERVLFLTTFGPSTDPVGVLLAYAHEGEPYSPLQSLVKKVSARKTLMDFLAPALEDPQALLAVARSHYPPPSPDTTWWRGRFPYPLKGATGEEALLHGLEGIMEVLDPDDPLWRALGPVLAEAGPAQNLTTAFAVISLLHAGPTEVVGHYPRIMGHDLKQMVAGTLLGRLISEVPLSTFVPLFLHTFREGPYPPPVLMKYLEDPAAYEGMPPSWWIPLAQAAAQEDGTWDLFQDASPSY